MGFIDSTRRYLVEPRRRGKGTAESEVIELPRGEKSPYLLNDVAAGGERKLSFIVIDR